MDVWYNGKYGVSFYEYGGELNPLGKFLGHTWKDWSLIPTVRPFVVPPPHKTSEMDAKGINGKADVSNKLLGFPLFENREGSWTFYIADFNDYSDHIQDNNGEDILDSLGDSIRATRVQDFSTKYSQLLLLLQGKDVAIVLDEDPIHFYKGSVQIESFVASNDSSLNGLTIKYDLYPYKMKIEMTEKELDAEYMSKYLTYFSVSSDYPMIMIPYAKIEFSAEVSSQAQILFSNPELGISVAAWPYGTNYNFVVKSGEWFRMAAAYGEGQLESHPSYAISNMTGNNQMWMCARDKNQKAFSSFKLKYREGRL